MADETWKETIQTIHCIHGGDYSALSAEQGATEFKAWYRVEF
jgi:hypothetical protein